MGGLFAGYVPGILRKWPPDRFRTGFFLFESYDFVVAWNKYFFNFVKNNPDNTSPAEILLDPRISHK